MHYLKVLSRTHYLDYPQTTNHVLVPLCVYQELPLMPEKPKNCFC